MTSRSISGQRIGESGIPTDGVKLFGGKHWINQKCASFYLNLLSPWSSEFICLKSFAG
jgi:hypothetical protein